MVLLFLGLQKNKPNRRAQGLCFCFFLGLFFGASKKTNPIGGHKGCVFVFVVLSKKQLEGHKGCVFAFLVLSEKTNPIGGHKGCIFGFCGASKKNKSNTRAEIEGNVCLRETNRAHAGGSHPVPPSGSSGSGAYFIH